MILFYSGDGSHWAQPEIMLEGDSSNIMLTFYSSRQKVNRRFRLVYKARRNHLRSTLQKLARKKGNK